MELAEEAVKKTTTFIQNLSHQIRTPLNIIMGFANVIHENIVSRSKREDALDPFHDINVGKITDMMKHNTIQLKRMILMLFDSSSTVDELMGNRTDEVSCNEVVRESIDYTLGHFQKLDVKFESELSDATHILTSHIYLTRTLRELLDNAANYSDGKHITLQVSQTETTVNFTITDVGPGLPENAEELIFKPFIKFDDMSEGLGLGLPLCKRHALSLGGDLIYDKDYKEGCRFILQMPK
jgi:signal transduction histidine kinase